LTPIQEDDMSDTTPLAVWLQGFPKDETEARIRELERELANLRNAIALHDSFGKPNGDQPHEEAAGDPANGPDAIRRVRWGNLPHI
jgi:hypothetical protein